MLISAIHNVDPPGTIVANDMNNYVGKNLVMRNLKH